MFQPRREAVGLTACSAFVLLCAIMMSNDVCPMIPIALPHEWLPMSLAHKIGTRELELTRLSSKSQLHTRSLLSAFACQRADVGMLFEVIFILTALSKAPPVEFQCDTHVQITASANQTQLQAA